MEIFKDKNLSEIIKNKLYKYGREWWVVDL